ncbi:integrase [Paenibacillus sp. CAA11]|nr:integrase [Paenibacillus sp. CAA11]
MTWEQALAGFLDYKTAQGISAQTYEDYDKHARLFFKRFPNAWNTPDNLTEGLYAHLSEEVKPATFNNRLIYLRTFLNWCVEKGIITHNPIANMKKRKDEGRVVAVDERILQKLLEMPDQSTFVGLRDYALILLTLDTGIRPKEALTLLPCDFNPASYEIYIPAKNAKTRISRTLPISDITLKTLKRLLAARPAEWGEEAPIFCTYEGRSLNRHTWGDRLEKYTRELGVHIRPYDLRHAFSLEYIRNGANSFALQKTLGHTSMEMTKRYVALVTDDLKAEHAKASPLNKLMKNTKRTTKI